jgi:hypothetical protein
MDLFPMTTIQTLKPNVTLDEAIHTFSSRGLINRTRELALGPLQSVADFYIPFRVFTIQVVNRGKCDRYILGLDAVNGSLNPYSFEQAPSTNEMVIVETRNRVPSSLSDEEANDLIIAKVRRIIFSSGFFRVMDLRISAEALPDEIHIPYWVGFRGRGTNAHVTVMDAVRRRLEGGKVRHLLRSWINSSVSSAHTRPKYNWKPEYLRNSHS